jgi:hypothetical protein
MRGELTVFQDLDNPNRWQGPFRGSPPRWKAADGEAVVRSLHEAQANPVARPLGRLAKIRTKPAVAPGSAGGGVSVPEDDEPALQQVRARATAAGEAFSSLAIAATTWP